jgi:hypothetical protein
VCYCFKKKERGKGLSFFSGNEEATIQTCFSAHLPPRNKVDGRVRACGSSIDALPLVPPPRPSPWTLPRSIEEVGSARGGPLRLQSLHSIFVNPRYPICFYYCTVIIFKKRQSSTALKLWSASSSNIIHLSFLWMMKEQ